MGKKRRILLAAMLVILLVGFAWWLLRPREPSYQGKSLSAWLAHSTVYGLDSPDAIEAVRQIGTNAIPTLIRMLRANDSPLRTKSIELLDRQDLVRVKIIRARDENYQAFLGFDSLGLDGKIALPELIEIYDEGISTDSQSYAARSIGSIGPGAKSAIPSLLKGLKTTNDSVCWPTALALGSIHCEPELVVPELVRLLQHSNPVVRSFDIIALGNFGTNARSAIPDLTLMLSDQDANIRVAATNSLKQIDSEAAAKAGVK
jgi:hypothetical protein